MLNTRNKFFIAVAIALATIAAGTSGCKKDTVKAKMVYQLKVKDQLGISGTVTFTETNSTVTTIDIALSGADAESHPAFIQLNSAVEGGAVAVTLNPVVSGASSTQVTKLDNSSAINYSQLIAFNGYVSVSESTSNPGLILAQSDIGGNELTTTSKSYVIDSVGSSGVLGTALFQKRKNGNTLVSILLTGTLSGDIYPATINIGSVSTVGGGPIVKTLNAVDGTSGKSYTNIITLNDGTSASYDALLLYDGYLAIHQSLADMNTILCQGNIGTH